jgi:drug/metabolite transporter (DMT)-like permease
MGPAFLAALLFATSSVAAKRAVFHFGSASANLFRILVAAVLLAAYSHRWGAGLQGPSLYWFLASGLIGFGICDTAIFLSLPRIGAHLTSLLVQCLAAPVAAVAEWLWLGTSMGAWETVGSGLILGGVALALVPSKHAPGRFRPNGAGVALGVIAAIGQALGAVISRHGQLLSREAGFSIDALSVAYQRILAGVFFSLAWWIVVRLRTEQVSTPKPQRANLNAWGWVGLNAIAGPFLGVGSYQWALQLEPTGVVMTIASLTPLAVVPLAWWLDGERPRLRSVSGGVVAVLGVVLLAHQRK